MKGAKKVKFKALKVGDVIGFFFREIPEAQTPEPWIGTICRLYQKESLNIRTGRWTYKGIAEVLWSETGKVLNVTQDDWDPPKDWSSRYTGYYMRVSKSK